MLFRNDYLCGEMSEIYQKSARSSRAPRITYGIGREFRIGSRSYRVIERSGIVLPCDACMGCAFANRRCPDNIACSSFDRRDGVSVWFVEL